MENMVNHVKQCFILPLSFHLRIDLSLSGQSFSRDSPVSLTSRSWLDLTQT